MMKKVMHASGIQDLYCHQTEAIDIIRSGCNVVVATPTASGKTAIYNLPVLEKICENATARALYIFPLKALAQDQLRTFQEMIAFWEEGSLPRTSMTVTPLHGIESESGNHRQMSF